MKRLIGLMVASALFFLTGCKKAGPTATSLSYRNFPFIGLLIAVAVGAFLLGAVVVFRWRLTVLHQRTNR